MKEANRLLNIVLVWAGIMFAVAVALYNFAGMNMGWSILMFFIFCVTAGVKWFIWWVDKHPAVRISKKGWSVWTGWRKKKSPAPPSKSKPATPARGPVVVDPSDPRTILLDPLDPVDPDPADPTVAADPPETDEHRGWPRWKTVLVAFVLLWFGVFIIRQFAGSSTPTPTKQTTTATRKTDDRPSASAKKGDSKGKPTEAPAEEDGYGGVPTVIFTIVLLAGIGAGLHTQRHEGKFETSIKDPVFGSVIAMVGLNILSWMAMGSWWSGMAGLNSWLFIAMNLVVVLITFVYTLGKGNGFKIAAYALSIVIVLGILKTGSDLSKSSDTLEKLAQTVDEAVTPTPAPKVDHPVLATIAPHAPEKFDAPEKVAEATKEYREQGLEPYLGTASEWGPKLTAPEFTLAYVEAQPGRISRVIKIPTTVGGYKAYCIAVGNGDYKVRFNKKDWVENGDPPYKKTIRFVEVMGVDGPAKVRVYMAK